MSNKLEKRTYKRTLTVVSVLLSIAAIASSAAYLVYRIAAERAYKEKWKDYDDCGI